MAKKKIEQNIVLPDFKVDRLPKVMVKSIHFQNYLAFDNYKFDFVNKNNDIMDFICFIGPMGSGKSTALYTIQLLFSHFNGYEKDRIENNLSKSIRNDDSNKLNKDFKITAEIIVDNKTHKIVITKNGFKTKHPKLIRDLLYRICYLSKLDQDLNKFQLRRNKWDKFKSLFESVTGYIIEEYKNPFFGESSDPRQAQLLQDYVLEFKVKKPYETIIHKQCSDGEKKIIKSFSTMLNLEYTPPVILIDNFEMHVHRFRHMSLLKALRDCYPESQIFSTTHSPYVSKVLGGNVAVYDMRLIKANEFVKKEPWRLKIADEIDECIIKLNFMKDGHDLIEEAEKIKALCYGTINDLQTFQKRLGRFFNNVSEIFVGEVISRGL